MIELTETEPSRPGLRIRPEETWELARRDYLAGHSGPAVCARYGLGLAAFRKRAAAGGWRRLDQPVPMPRTPIKVIGNLDEASYFDLSEMAAIHLREAIVNGSATEAATWLRIHLRLKETDDPEPFCDPDEVDEVDDIDRVLSARESTVSP